jgi:hypothetical protein
MLGVWRRDVSLPGGDIVFSNSSEREHGMSAAQWAFWLAVAALIAATGKFIDDYHIKVVTKTKMRDALIKWFVWLDAHKVPDLGGVVLSALRGLFQFRRFTLLAVSLAFAYWATLSAFYLGREIFGPANDQSYATYLLTWIPLDRSAPFWLAFLAALLVPAVLGLVAMAHFFHHASLTNNDASRVGFLVAGLVFGIIPVLLGASLALVAFGGGGYFVYTIVLAALASVALPALLASFVTASISSAFFCLKCSTLPVVPPCRLSLTPLRFSV